MSLSIKHPKFLTNLLVCSLIVVGLITSVTRRGEASRLTATPPKRSTTFEGTESKTTPQGSAIDEATRARVNETYARLPLRFEVNRGQFDQRVNYVARGLGSMLFLTPTEAVLSLGRDEKKQTVTKEEAISARRLAIPAKPQPSTMSVVRMRLQGANRSPVMSGEREMNARTNYFIGNDPQKWQTDVTQYERVRYEEVYPGIDMIYYGQGQNLEYDFEVAPWADPQRISIGFKGVRTLTLEAATGDLLLKTASGEIRQHKPVTYQEINGERLQVESRYVKKGKCKVGIKVGKYDRTQPLVIDPTLFYSTYLGGSGDDFGTNIAVDALGNAYVTGFTFSTNFPTVNPAQGTSTGGPEAFVTKLNATGNALIYSTYLGGNGQDFGDAIAVDGAGNAYVTGQTDSGNFPCVNPFQASYGGGQDAFVTKLNAAGNAIVYSTYLGVISYEAGLGIAVNNVGNAYVTGYTYFSNFPTVNAAQATFGGTSDAFVTKFSPTGDTLVYSTFLGGGNYDYGQGIALDSAENVYVTGWTLSGNFPTVNPAQATHGGNYDVFVAKLNVSGNTFLYATYLGGSNVELANSIAVDRAGNACVTGYTQSSNFPTMNAYQASNGGGTTDVFVTKVSAAGNAFLYSTYLGGNGEDIARGITTDAFGNAYVTGYTGSTNFPTLNPYQLGQGDLDAFVTKLNMRLSGAPSLLYSTYLGGTISDLGSVIASDVSGSVYVTGYTQSSNFPTRHQFQTYRGGYDAYVTKFCFPREVADFDTDQKTDFAFWRPSDGNWQVNNSVNGSASSQHWGQSGDKIVPGDYDADGKTDFAVWRPSEGAWYILNSADNGFIVQVWGLLGDKPVARDYDGDGKTDVAVYRPSTGTWYVVNSSNNSVTIIVFGSGADKPVPADYDGDGKAEPAVVRVNPSGQLTWYIYDPQIPDFGKIRIDWGLEGDRAVPADYDGDCRTDVAVFRPSTGVWHILRSSDNTSYAVQWGISVDTAVPGDYDGDGYADIAVWREPIGMWYILKSTDGTLIQRQLGGSGDVPVPSAYLPE